jgi:hypothetical protein
MRLRKEVAMEFELAKGVAVEVHPAAYPGQIYPGVIIRRAKHGWRVRVECAGMKFNENYYESEIAEPGVNPHGKLEKIA